MQIRLILISASCFQIPHQQEEEEEAASFGVWMPVIEDEGPPEITFSSIPGPRHGLPPDASSVDYLKLFLTPDLIEEIVQQTTHAQSVMLDCVLSVPPPTLRNLAIESLCHA